MKRRPRRPVPIAHRLIARWVAADRRADVEADLDELFDARVARRGAIYAQIRYLLDVLSLRPRRPSIRAADRQARSPRITGAWQDVVFGLRLLRKRPGSVAITVLGLAVGVGVSTAAFTFLNVAALRPYGVSRPSSLVAVHRRGADGLSNFWPVDAYRAFSPSRAITLVASTGQYGAPVRLEDDIEIGEITVAFVSGGYFPTLAGRGLGRTITPADDEPGAAPVVVVNHAVWVRVFRADRSVVGRTIFVNGKPATLIGVAEAGFTGPTTNPPAFWAPLAQLARHFAGARAVVTVTGRLSPGVSAEQALGELSGLAAGLASTGSPAAADVLSVHLADASRSRASPRLWSAAAVIAVVVGLVLLLACANVTNIMLASALQRRREIALRLSLGASRMRVVRQLLTESMMVAGLGASLGLVAATWIVPMIAGLVELDPAIDLAPDLRVYTFVSAIALITGLGAGLVPARQGTSGDLLTPLQGDGVQTGGTVRGRRLRNWLVGGQAAASVLLLVLAALLTRALWHATRLDLGYEPDRLVVVRPAFSDDHDTARVADYWRTSLARVTAFPGVESAGLTSSPPFTGASQVLIFNRAGRRFTINFVAVDARFFQTLPLAAVRGRVFSDDDVSTAQPVAVISETLAREFWPGEDPIGSSLDRVSDTDAALRVIGVVPQIVNARLREPNAAIVYRPIRDLRSAYLLVRTFPRADTVGGALRDALTAIAPELGPAVFSVRSSVNNQIDDVRTLATLTGALGASALGLAVVGIFGVTSFLVGQRTREISVRIAIGASAADVVSLLLRETFRPVGIGVAVGVGLALLSARVLSGLMHGLSPYDPLAFAGATAVLIAAAGVAILVPARRALLVDPASALRQ